MEAKLEFIPRFKLVKESANGIKTWKVEAIHVTTTGNKREYTKEELILAARSFSYRPLNINHDSNRWLAYNWQDPTAEDSNTTLEMDFDTDKNGVSGDIQVVDQNVNFAIASGRINKLSIEQIPTKGESCGCSMAGGCKCTQKGVTGIGLALLESDVPPGDPTTNIKAEAYDKKKGEPFGDYSDFADCVAKNQSVDDPEAYCAAIQAKTEAGQDCLPHHKLQADGTCMPNLGNSSQNTETSKKCHTMSSTEEVKKVEAKSDAKLPGVLEDRIVPIPLSEFESYKSTQQKEIEKLEKEIGVHKTEIEKIIERYTPKEHIEAAKVESSSKVGIVSSPRTKFLEARDSMGAWLKNGSPGGNYKIKIDLDEFIQKNGYAMNEEGKVVGKRNLEALTPGTQPIDYQVDPIVIASGQLPIPIRQYVKFARITSADRAAWYTTDTLDFGAITEGTPPSEDTIAITQVTAVPSTRGTFLKVKYSSIEDNPYPLVDSLNMLAMRAAVDAEANEILNTIADATTPASNSWFNGNTGAVLTDDDQIGASATLTLSGVNAAKKYLDTQGYGPQGPYVAALHPKAYSEIITASGISTFVQQGIPEITRSGILSSLLGVQLVMYDQVTAKDNTSFDTYRNSLFVPDQAFGLAAAREFTIKAEERSENQQLFWIATHRIAGKILDNTARTRVSTSQ